MKIIAVLALTLLVSTACLTSHKDRQSAVKADYGQGSLSGAALAGRPVERVVTIMTSAAGETNANIAFLDSPSSVGMKVRVEFIDDARTYAALRCYDEGNVRRDPSCDVDQLITQVGSLEGQAQNLAIDLIERSGTDENRFQEYGGIMIYLTNGQTLVNSEPFTDGRQSAISTEHFVRGIRTLISQNMDLFNNGVLIEEIESYHTHLFPGEAVAPADMFLLNIFYDGKISKYFAGGNIPLSIYAMPTRGKNIFALYTMSHDFFSR